MPALIDGRMRPEEWRGVTKTDFEHHSFGKTELNIVDPAYDLAAATLAFRLAPDEERRLLDAYARDSADADVGDRILPYQLLYGSLVMTDALGRACRDPSEARHEWNRRYVEARAFLASRLARFAASRIPAPASVSWTQRLFFLDLDGVFDSEVFGFPHTTTSGLAALDLLRRNDFSVVLGTGRSVADVRAYCRDYGLPGGLAESGAVFVDAVAGRELPVVEEAELSQLARCREALARLPGVCVDPSYRYAVRAYRYVDDRTVPPGAPLEAVLEEMGLERLTLSPSSVDTIVLPRGVDKGRGLKAARDYLGCADQPVAAIGDSDRDVPMLAAADLAYAPSGCSAGVRSLAGQGRCRIMRAPMQHGLLRAARDLASRLPPPSVGPRPSGVPAPATQAATSIADLLATLLRVAERSRFRQALGALAWWRL